MISLVELPHSRIDWYPEHKVILKTITGECTGDELRILFNTGYEQLKEEGGIRWLSDNRKLRPYRPDDVLWLNESWMPRMREAGWKYWGLVEPVTALGSRNMKHFSFYSGLGITVRRFKTVDEGMAWIIRAGTPGAD